MDESHQHIVNLIKQQGETTAAQIKAVVIQVEAGFSAASQDINSLKDEIVLVKNEMAGYKEAKKIQNGRIDKLENRVVVRLSKFGEEKTRVFFFYILIAYLGLAELFQYVSISDFAKKYLP